jgi:hypothetical protein
MSTTRIYPYDVKTKKVDSLLSVIELSTVGGKVKTVPHFSERFFVT